MVKILFLAANPTDVTRLRLDEESRVLDQVLRPFRATFEIALHNAVRVTDLQELLLRHQPHIVHFCGHGSDTGEIILADEQGYSQPVSPAALAQLFALLKDNIRCVVLNACYAAAQATAIAEEIGCVIGMSTAISDVAAIRFVTAFYQALGYGRDVKTAFDLGCAQLALENLGEQDIPQLLPVGGDQTKLIFVARAEANASAVGLIDKIKLRKVLIEGFSLEELDLLCADLEQRLANDGITLPVNLELIGGSGKAGKVLNLIGYLDRRGYLPYLATLVREERATMI